MIRSRSWVLAATIAGSSMVFINGSTVNVALPALQQQLGASVTGIQWVVNAYSLFLAALILLGGSLGDQFGRRRMFMIGVGLFAAASLGCGLSPNLPSLVAARAVQGVGGALLTPGSLAIISATFEGEAEGRAIGLWAGFSALTSALGPVLGGWLIDTASWRWIFFLHLPLALVVLALSWTRVPESRDEDAGDLDWWGALLVTAGLASLTYGLIDSSNRSFGHPLVLGTLVAGGLLLALFLWVEARQDDPMMPLSLFRSSTFSGANALTLLLYMALGGLLFFLPMNLIQVYGYSATAAGAALLPFSLLMALLSSWAGGLVDRVGARLPLLVGPAIAAVGFFLFGFLPQGPGDSYWSTFFPAAVVLGLGMAVSVAPLTTAVMQAAPETETGTASGINNAAARLANLVAIAVFGIVMVRVFSARLASGLAGRALSPEVTETILARRNDLAALDLPGSMGPEAVAAAERAIHGAFTAGFDVVAYVTAGLALAGAVIGWVTVRD